MPFRTTSLKKADLPSPAPSMRGGCWRGTRDSKASSLSLNQSHAMLSWYQKSGISVFNKATSNCIIPSMYNHDIEQLPDLWMFNNSPLCDGENSDVTYKYPSDITCSFMTSHKVHDQSLTYALLMTSYFVFLVPQCLNSSPPLKARKNDPQLLLKLCKGTYIIYDLEDRRFLWGGGQVFYHLSGGDWIFFAIHFPKSVSNNFFFQLRGFRVFQFFN